MPTNAKLVRDGLVWAEQPAVGQRVALRASRCPACARIEFPRLATCPACLADVEEVPLGPEARLAGFTTVSYAPPGASVPVPYIIAVAAFDGNLSVMGLFDGPVPLDELELGIPLETCVIEPFDGGYTYGFRLRFDE